MVNWLIEGSAVCMGPGLVLRILLLISREGETDTEGGFISLAMSGRGESPIPARHNNYVCRRMKVIPRDKVSTDRGCNKLLNTFLKARKNRNLPGIDSTIHCWHRPRSDTNRPKRMTEREQTKNR